jgi:hypothetical protein
MCHLGDLARVVGGQRLPHRVRMRVLEAEQGRQRLVRVRRVAEGVAQVVEVERAVVASMNAAGRGADDDGVPSGLVPDDVRLGFRDDLAAALHLRHLADEVAHRAAGHEEAGFLAEELRRALLESDDRRVVAEHVVAELRIGHRAPHLGARVRDGV